MRAALGMIVVLAASGCTYDEWKYQQSLVQAECDYAMDCYSDAVLTFYGWNTAEDCAADRGPELAAAVATCSYDPEAAKQCIKELGELACQEGEDPPYPSVCDVVYTGCEAETDTGPGEPADTGDSA